MVFKASKPAFVVDIETKAKDMPEDYVTTRIMWLRGEESSNTGSNTSSYDRCVYIHGTNEEGLLGKPASHGCIRMKNADIIILFKTVTQGTLVLIDAGNILL